MAETKRKRKKDRTSLWVHIIFILFGAACVIPFMIVISASFSSDTDLARNGFSVLPRKVDLTAYAYILKNPQTILSAYRVTILITVIGTFLSVLFMSMAAYGLARSSLRLKKVLTFFVFCSGLFSGGLAPSYIINTQYLHLGNTLAVMIIPSLVNVYHMFMIRAFFKQLPQELFDAAKMDGASEYRIYFTIALPLSKPVLATVAFLGALARWNEWFSGLLYITKEELYPIQYLLERMMRNLQFLLDNMKIVPALVQSMDIPRENMKMAMLVIAIGPMMIVFPFFQKYFARGMTVGAIKG